MQPESCPEIADVLMAIDGELPSAQRAAILAHVASCAACQERVRNINQSVAWGREHELFSASAERARQARFRDVLETAEREDAQKRPWRWLAVAAAVLVAIAVAGVLSRDTRPAVEDPDEIVAKAVATERERPEAVQMVRIAITPAAVAPEGVWLLRELHRGVDDAGGVNDPVTRELRAMGIDLRRPLSAAAFQAWGHGIRDRRDRVSVTGDLLKLEMRAPVGRVRAAELTVQRLTYRVVGQVWLVDNVGRIEIQALSAAEAAAMATSAARSDERVPPVAADVESMESRAPDWDRVELDARWVASDIDVATERVQVARQGTRVVVSGTVTSTTRRQALIARLRALPGIAIKLTVAPAPPGGGGLEQWAARRFGHDIEARESFVRNLRRVATAVDGRGTSLTVLAERYPAQVAEGLSPPAGRKLEQLVTREYTALTNDLLTLEGRLRVLGVATQAGLLSPPSTAPRNWRARVEKARGALAELHAAVDDVASYGEVPVHAVRAGDAFVAAWTQLVGREATH